MKSESGCSTSQPQPANSHIKDADAQHAEAMFVSSTGGERYKGNGGGSYKGGGTGDMPKFCCAAWLRSSKQKAPPAVTISVDRT